MYPLPGPEDLSCCGFSEVPEDCKSNALSLSHGVLVALSYGYGMSGMVSGVPSNLAQRTCLLTIRARIVRFVARLASDVPVNTSPEFA